MKKRIGILLLLLAAGLLVTGILVFPRFTKYGFARQVSPEEAGRRTALLSTAQQWVGCSSRDGSHKPIIDLYNSHQPLAVDYVVQYTDKWCAAFVSAAAIQCGMTDIIPTECGCQRQIGLFEALGRWEEDDDYVPLPGDIIYYSEKGSEQADNTGWSDHVGIVVGTRGSRIKVLEGNINGVAGYRYIQIGDPSIRGYGLPDYS